MIRTMSFDVNESLNQTSGEEGALDDSSTVSYNKYFVTACNEFLESTSTI